MADSKIQILISARDQASRVFKQLNRNMSNYSQQMRNVGQSMSMYVTAPLTLLGGLSIKTAADFSRSMSKVGAVTQATGGQIEDLEKTAKKFGRTTEHSTTQVADAMKYMGMAGMETNKILKSTGKVLDLATIGQMEMSKASDIATNIMAGFGMKSEEVDRMVDTLAKTITNANTTVGEMGEAMSYAAPVAKGFGIKFEETAAMVGKFSDRGIKASKAGTSLRQAIVQLQKKSDELGITMNKANGQMRPMTEILSDFEDRGYDAAQAVEDFGTRSATALVTLLQTGSDNIREFTKELENSAGYSEKVAGRMRKGLHAELDELKSAFEGVQIAMVDSIESALTPFIRALTTVMRTVAGMSKGTRTLIASFGALAAATGPLLIGLSFIPAVLGRIKAGAYAARTALYAMSAHPVIAALTVLAAAVIYVRGKIIEFGEEVGNVGVAWKMTLTNMKINFWEFVRNVLEGVNKVAKYIPGMKDDVNLALSLVNEKLMDSEKEFKKWSDIAVKSGELQKKGAEKSKEAADKISKAAKDVASGMKDVGEAASEAGGKAEKSLETIESSMGKLRNKIFSTLGDIEDRFYGMTDKEVSALRKVVRANEDKMKAMEYRWKNFNEMTGKSLEFQKKQSDEYQKYAGQVQEAEERIRKIKLGKKVTPVGEVTETMKGKKEALGETIRGITGEAPPERTFPLMKSITPTPEKAVKNFNFNFQGAFIGNEEDFKKKVIDLINRESELKSVAGE